jgi:hypothetical protein
MTLDLQGLPLIDRPDVDTLLADGRFGRWSQQAANLSRRSCSSSRSACWGRLMNGVQINISPIAKTVATTA